MRRSGLQRKLNHFSVEKSTENQKFQIETLMKEIQYVITKK